MESTDRYYIDCLTRDIEHKIGRTFRSATDFDRLESLIAEHSPDRLNASTLKRIWGYSTRRCAPRLSTLTILARILGYIDWDEYVGSIDAARCIESGFISTSTVSTSDLSEGDLVSFRWNPDRKVVLRYLGRNTFRVEQHHNSSIHTGDELQAEQICEGAPFYCTDVTRHGKHLGHYIAGEETGIQALRLHPHTN